MCEDTIAPLPLPIGEDANWLWGMIAAAFTANVNELAEHLKWSVDRTVGAMRELIAQGFVAPEALTELGISAEPKELTSVDFAEFFISEEDAAIRDAERAAECDALDAEKQRKYGPFPVVTEAEKAAADQYPHLGEL